MTRASLTGKRALVTGSASGIGAAIATALAAAGATVAIHARRSEQLGKTSQALEALGRPGVLVAADLRDGQAVRAMAARALDALGGLDILINNAGTVAIASVEEMDEKLWDRVLDTNLKAPWLVTRCLLAEILKSGASGRLIYISSISGKLAEAQSSAYNASKAGLLGFVRCVAKEVAVHGVTANAICPGWVDTPMADWCWQQTAAREGKAVSDNYDSGMRDNMMKVVVMPSDIAAMAVFLASDQARFITAQSVNVCGGTCYW
jgi:NAD(P)-dependent dehydrogenase (short-subunit alcohol dehydrogenase family)